jgi:hypothetical protein
MRITKAEIERRVDECIALFDKSLGPEWFENVRRPINVYSTADNPICQATGLKFHDGEEKLARLNSTTARELNTRGVELAYLHDPHVSNFLVSRVWNAKLEQRRRLYWGISLKDEENAHRFAC